MGDTLSGTYDRVLQRLHDENVQKAIASVFARYLDDLQEVLVLATARTGGVRPEGLTNEISQPLIAASAARSIVTAGSVRRIRPFTAGVAATMASADSCRPIPRCRHRGSP